MCADGLLSVAGLADRLSCLHTAAPVLNTRRTTVGEGGGAVTVKDSGDRDARAETQRRVCGDGETRGDAHALRTPVDRGRGRHHGLLVLAL